MMFGALQVMDYGYPQFTEAKILSEFIKTDAYKMEVATCLLHGGSHLPCLESTHTFARCSDCIPLNPMVVFSQVQARPPMAVTNAVSWRSEGIR